MRFENHNPVSTPMTIPEIKAAMEQLAKAQESLAKELERLEQADKMPKLKTGMFGKTKGGRLFIVMGDTLVYQDGKYWGNTSSFNEFGRAICHYTNDDDIVALYEAKCFDLCTERHEIWSIS